MLCEKPFLGAPNGVRPLDVVLSDDARRAATPFGCGQCGPCRINKAKIWVTRITLEAMLYEKNGFVTLTYNDWYLPEDGKVCRETGQKFMKRLRKRLGDRKVRYYGVGEYGEKKGRPHYHIILFGCDASDRLDIERAWSVNGDPIGLVHIGNVNPASARYVTGYIVKALRDANGKRKEFQMSSTRPGVGRDAMEKIAAAMVHDPKMLNSVKIGKRNMPLGRYLSSYLDELQDMSAGARSVQSSAEMDLIFDDILEGNGVYADRLRAMDEGARASTLKRQAMFSAKRRLEG